jgi:hypothetical protein
MDETKTVAAYFTGYFEGSYDGSYDTPEAEQPRADFIRLTNYQLMWAQVHGNFKDAAKRETFQPYPHWRELHDCCGRIVRQYAKDRAYWHGEITGARIMQDAMRLLKSLYDLNAPRWWIPLMRQMRGEGGAAPTKGSNFVRDADKFLARRNQNGR